MIINRLSNAVRRFVAQSTSTGQTKIAPAWSIRTSYQIHARYFSNHQLTESWPESIKTFLKQQNIDKPTDIQERTLPHVLDNKNLVGIARTGSGKTLAFVIPAVIKVLKSREEQQIDQGDTTRQPTCLILAPTRELAGQTADVIGKFRKFDIRSISLVGGSSRSEQVRALTNSSHDIYVATPGRFQDLIDSDLLDLSQINYLVLDEADRMLDMGFEPQIRRILQSLPKKRQTLMWSATWPQEIQMLAAEFLDEFEYVAVDSENLKANPNITQVIEVCQPGSKFRVLLDYLQKFKEECEQPRTLIFTNTKRMADTMLLQLMRNKHKAISIHGDRSQRQRDEALRLFKDRHCHTLVATDVAARGIDVSDITHVFNYDFPNSIEDYIHRIGRTARHERQGTAVTLFTENNANLAGKLIKVLKETDQIIPDELQEMAQNSRGSSLPTRRDYGRNDFRRREYGYRNNDRHRGIGGYRDDDGYRGYGRQQRNFERRSFNSQDFDDDDDDGFFDQGKSNRRRTQNDRIY